MDSEERNAFLLCDREWFARKLEELEASDPDYVCDVFGLTSADLIDKFYPRVKYFITKEYMDNEEEQD